MVITHFTSWFTGQAAWVEDRCPVPVRAELGRPKELEQANLELKRQAAKKQKMHIRVVGSRGFSPLL